MLQFDFRDPRLGAAPCRFADPIEIVEAHAIEQVLPCLGRVEEAICSGLYAAGFIAYEAATAFDPAMAVPPAGDLPLLWFGLFRAALPVEPNRSPAPYRVGDWSASVEERRFLDQIEQLRRAIGAGDVYQVNHTLRLRAPFAGDAFAWYHRLRAVQNGGFSAFLDTGRFQLLSLSPELFFHVSPQPDGARRVTTRPMKGTHPRGRYGEEDARCAERLRSCEKERAENLMIVDLVRNDLGRIAETGSVQVEDLFAVERYPTLLQMTSTVSARLRADVRFTDLLAALFPCGSVTGAPKIAAMQQIAALETEPRQVYCGAIGYLSPNGAALFSVPIRTVLLDREAGSAEYGVGSGITWDSQPCGEFAENRLKASLLSAQPMQPDLFETLRLEQGIYSRRDQHIDRLIASADYFGRPVERADLIAALNIPAMNHRTGLWRVRLVLPFAGQPYAAAEPLAAAQLAQPIVFGLSSLPIDRSDRRLFHKRCDRSLYQAQRSLCPHAEETLMINQDGELTEFTVGNLVLEIDGMRFTPPLECGLLPGVLRAELLKEGAVGERILTPRDLKHATGIWRINSLRGWTEARQVE